MIIFWIIVAILIFSLVILIHEFGHFIAARKFWVKVLEFGLWIPPKAKELFSDKLWTRYTLNWLPLWGFVRLNWEENIKNRDFSDKTKFYNKSYIQKSVILLAWVFMNFLLASVIFSVLFFIWIKPLWINDKIPTNLNSKIIPTYSQAINQWILIKKLEKIEVNRNFKYKYWIINSLKYWFTETYIQSVLTLKWLGILWKKIFSPEKPEDRQEALNQMSWPIWIVDFISHIFKPENIWILSVITAVISINLAIFNLLPIPALDWWRWFLLTINTIFQKIFWNKIKTETFENLIHLTFFIILIALSILIWYNDIIKIINR